MTTAEYQSQSFKECFWGPNGFEELKKYMRLGSEFCRDLASILTERAENEMTYSKGLVKSSSRLQTLSKENFGSLSDAWLKVGIQFNIESEMHKSMAIALQEEIIKPLKILADNQLKCRKPVETKIEKVIKNLADKKADDYKYRSRCFQLSKDIEKSMYGLDEAQKGVGGKPPNQKEIQKLEAQIVKSKESLEKSELKYHKACANVELARQDWQIEMIKGCDQLQTIEFDRISSLDQLIKKLAIQVNVLSKKMTKQVDEYQNMFIDVENDIKIACKKYGNGKNEQEINLYDIYAENTKNMMNRDRRIENLNKWTELLKADLQSQIKARQGLEKVRTFAKENPNFKSNNDADVALKLESVQLLQTLYDSSLFKIETSLAELTANEKPNYQYASLLNTTYDKQGVPITIMKLNSSTEINTLMNKPSAPSPPISPTQSISSNPFQSSVKPVGNISGTNISVPYMQMPTPVYNINPYDSAASNYAGGESSSASSISASSVSPVALTASSQSLKTAVATNQTAAASSKPSNSKSSYLLTTVEQQPPPYSVASLKRQKENENSKNAIENYYNNSIQSSSDDDDDWNEPSYKFVGKCTVQYDFKATRDDELTIFLGDQINIIEKREDGWWRGELRNSIGLFPSTYVKES